MNITAARKIITAVPLVAMLVLAGCGGGSERRQIADLQQALGETKLTPEAITALVTARMTAERERDAANAEVTGLMAALQAAEDERDQALADDQADQEAIDGLEAQIADLSSQIASLNSEITRLNAEIANLTELSTMADAEVTRLMTALQAAEDARDQALADDQADQDTIDGLNARIADLASQISDLTSRVPRLAASAFITGIDRFYEQDRAALIQDDRIAHIERTLAGC